MLLWPSGELLFLVATDLAGCCWEGEDHVLLDCAVRCADS